MPLGPRAMTFSRRSIHSHRASSSTWILLSDGIDLNSKLSRLLTVGNFAALMRRSTRRRSRSMSSSSTRRERNSTWSSRPWLLDTGSALLVAVRGSIGGTPVSGCSPVRIERAGLSRARTVPALAAPGAGVARATSRCRVPPRSAPALRLPAHRGALRVRPGCGSRGSRRRTGRGDPTACGTAITGRRWPALTVSPTTSTTWKTSLPPTRGSKHSARASTNFAPTSGAMPTPSRTTPSDIAMASGSRRPSRSPPSMRLSESASRNASRCAGQSGGRT